MRLAAFAGALLAFGAAMLLVVSESQVALFSSADPRVLPEIGVAPVVFAEPWKETPLPIHVVPAGAFPRGFIQIDGLPALALLSEGHATRPGSWKVPVSRLASLKITSPGTADGTPRLAIALVSHEGIVLSEARPLLAVVPTARLDLDPQPVLPSLPTPPAQCPTLVVQANAVGPAPAWVWAGAKLEAGGLIRRGDEAMSRGSIGAARQTYEYAAEELRWPTAALALAATYDPYELAYLAPLVAPDSARARQWYERARELANARIDFHVLRLGPASRAAEPLPPLPPEPAPLWVWFGAMEAKTIVAWGDEALLRGNIEAARQIYEYAGVVMRWPTAALSLAATYDPEELRQLGVGAPAAEPEKARNWYERSRELMNARIDFHLQRLGAQEARRPARPEPVASCR
jgi:hypothetical protein